MACFAIMILCLLVGIGDLSGFWQPLHIPLPMIQSVSGQDDDGDHDAHAMGNYAAWRDAVDVAQPLSFLQVYVEEIKWRISLVFLSSSPDRAPPRCS
jgi:hypothetical protein